MDRQEFETIKSRLRRIQALAEQGYEGGAKVAKHILDKLCEQYGVTLEDILDESKTEKYYFKIGREPIWLNLFCQCFSQVTGEDELSYYQSRSSKGTIGVELTAFQFAEISNLFKWHKENLKKDLDNMQKLTYDAYIQKHRIFPKRSNDPEVAEDKKEDKPVDLAYIQRLLAMMGNLNDNRYHKQIEAK